MNAEGQAARRRSGAIRDARVLAGLDEATLAGRTGIPVHRLRAIEAGRADADMPELICIAAATDVLISQVSGYDSAATRTVVHRGPGPRNLAMERELRWYLALDEALEQALAG